MNMIGNNRFGEQKRGYIKRLQVEGCELIFSVICSVEFETPPQNRTF
jgi:hypothetical protein